MTNDDLTILERMLRDRAAEVSYLQEPPPKMLVRARRRVARNALSSVAIAGLFVVGILAGIGSLRALPTPSVIPGGPTPTPGPQDPSCIATDLRATAALQGAAGSVLGSIDLTNLGATRCTLTGRPILTLSSSAGHLVSVQVVGVAPQWNVDGASAPQGWPVVGLSPGSAGSVRVRWTNACPQLTGPVLWTVDLGNGGGMLDVSGTDATYPPPCSGPSEPSTLEVGPFEPRTGR